MSKSLYIHIPFCRRKCPYCDFYSISYDKALSSTFIKILSSQIEKLPNDFSTVYIGGGTPSVLSKPLFLQLFKSLNEKIKKASEVTIESNPESLSKEKIELFLDNGINRLSIGLQSLEDGKLKKLGRIHTSAKAVESVFLAKKCGFNNISVDMIFGVWGQTLNKWKSELKEIIKLPIEHISTYALTYERGTPLFKSLKEKRIFPLAESAVADMYEFAMSYLPKQGFMQYEVSNFAKKRFACRHNLIYWDNGYYLGLGPSAVSFTNRVRTRNVSGVIKYIEKIAHEQDPFEFKERLSEEKFAHETAALKIRTSKGIDFSWFNKQTGFDFVRLEKEVLDELVDKELLKYKKVKGKDVGVYLSRKGFLFADTASSSLL